MIAQGSLEDILNSEASITGQYLSGKLGIAVPTRRLPQNPARQLRILGASGNNLQKVNLTIPIGLMTCVNGVSGSGK